MYTKIPLHSKQEGLECDGDSLYECGLLKASKISQPLMDVPNSLEANEKLCKYLDNLTE